MSDQEEDERPIPKGTYNFNFDDLDEFSDPFKSSKGLMNSPDKDAPNPFQSRSKMCASPPLPTHSKNNQPEENPFQTKTKLGSSPPSGTAISVPAENNVDSESAHDDSAESFKTAAEESPVKQKGLKTRAKSKTPPAAAETESQPVEESPADKASDEAAPAIVEEPAKPPPKKKASPKKPGSGIKKPKARTKFKPPPNFGAQESEDVVIFAPPPPATQEGEENQELPQEDFPPPPPPEPEPEPEPEPIKAPVVGLPEDTVVPEDIVDGPTNGDSDHMVPQMTNQLPVPGMEDVNFMMDSVHDFGAAEMPIENNEGCVPPSEAFNEDNPAWEMSTEDQVSAGRESPCAFDELPEDQVPDKVKGRRISEPNLEENGLEDDEPPQMSAPAQPRPGGNQPRPGVARNPAARALQEQQDGTQPGGALTQQQQAHVIDKSMYSHGGGRGDEIKLPGEGGHLGDEKYFDALEYPIRKAHMQGESDVERMNSANKKHGAAGETNQDNIVQLVQVLKYSQSDWNKQKQELELDFNARLLNKEREWSKKLADRDKKIAYLDEQVLLLRSANEDMKCVVKEFEKTISQLQADKEKKTTETLDSYENTVKERDQALDDLQSVETAFSDLHQRYERTKGVVEGFKKNEDVLKKCVQDYQVKLKTAEDKALSVRNQAEEKLHQASEEMEKLRKATTAEVARLEAALKKTDLKIQGLENGLEQKVKENDELTAICDELIAKVGGE